jgi:hypothetical protein
MKEKKEEMTTVRVGKDTVRLIRKLAGRIQEKSGADVSLEDAICFAVGYADKGLDSERRSDKK